MPSVYFFIPDCSVSTVCLPSSTTSNTLLPLSLSVTPIAVPVKRNAIAVPGQANTGASGFGLIEATDEVWPGGPCAATRLARAATRLAAPPPRRLRTAASAELPPSPMLPPAAPRSCRTARSARAAGRPHCRPCPRHHRPPPRPAGMRGAIESGPQALSPSPQSSSSIAKPVRIIGDHCTRETLFVTVRVSDV